MVTEAEIEAACRAFHPEVTPPGVTPPGVKVWGWDAYSEGVRQRCRIYMRIALEAAERLRTMADEPEMP